MVRRKKSASTDRKGIAAVQLTVVDDLGWIFREQPTEDYGIDAHIEVVEDEPTGRLLALQIKSGKSYFAKPTPDGAGVTYYIDPEHLEYWLAHSLPVLVVLVRPDGSAIWERVTDSNVKHAKEGWKIVVPFSQRLDASAAPALQSIACVSPYQARLNRLVVDRPLMQLVHDGAAVRLEISEWIHKSSGRGSLKIVIVDDSGDQRVLHEFRDFIAPGWDYEDLAGHLFPWADMPIDSDHYQSFDEAQWNEECGAYDSETDEYIVHSEDFHEWCARQPAFRPYEVASDEVARYRLALELNDLGTSFLIVDRHLVSG